MRRFWFLLFPILLAPSLLAQTAPDLETGFNPYGSYHGGNIDSVNLANGALSLHIPFLSYPQRGALKLSFSLRYDGKAWSVIKQGVFPNTWLQWTGNTQG